MNPSPTRVPHPVLVGVAAGLDIAGSVLLTNARRVPRAHKEQWRRSVVVTMVTFHVVLLTALLGAAAWIVLGHGPEWSVAPGCALLLASPVCVEVLSRQQRPRAG